MASTFAASACRRYVGMHTVTIKVSKEGVTPERIDFGCMIIRHRWIGSLERKIMSTGWPIKKHNISIDYCPAENLSNFKCSMPFLSNSNGKIKQSPLSTTSCSLLMFMPIISSSKAILFASLEGSPSTSISKAWNF